MRLPPTKTVDEYIAAAPKAARGRLREFRTAIRAAAPKAKESISYRMPYYSYKGRLAWFALQSSYVGLYLRPPTVAEHKKELSGYVTTKSAIHFPLERKMPIRLVKKLIKAAMKKNEEGD
jgi:uncharacterized protein YdhG (YjbR/CyaY superfamily)